MGIISVSRQAWKLGCVVVAVAGLALPGWAADFYVDVSWTGTASGTQTEPFTTIKAAVDAANAIAATHNIYIAAGWYGDVANGGTEDYSAGGGPDGGINITRRIRFYGGYAGWDGEGTDPANFNWTEGSRIPRTTAIDLQDAGSRAFYSTVGDYTGPLYDGLSFSNANHGANGGCISGVGGWGRTYYVNNCLFSNNTVTGSADGAAFYLSDSASGSYIRNSDFIDNTASGGNGGAIFWVVSYGGSRDMSDCTFVNNEANIGGAIYTDGNITIQRTIFTNNTATAYGGAIYNHRDTLTIRRTIFVANAAPAGAAMGRTPHTSWGGAFVLENCQIYRNTGGYAVQVEGVRYGSYSLDMLHCTVVGNTGGGVRFQHAGSGTTPGRVRSSIIAHNGAYGIYRVDDPYILSHNNVYDNASGNYLNCDPDDDSISVDPDFIDADNDDYRLAITSPSIDAGEPDTGLLTDFAGNPRPTRNGWDQGAYEELQAARVRNLAPVTTSTDVTLRGILDTDGELPTEVRIFWGPDNGGTDAAAWAHTNIIGETVAPAAFDAYNTLTPGESYWFRCYASNAYDEVWADASWSFTAEDVHLWTGLAGDGLASTAGNWFDDFLPTVNGTVKLDSYQADMTWDAAAPHRVLRWEQTDQYNGTVTIATGWSNGFDRLTIDTDMTLEGGTVTHLDNTVGGVPYYRLKLDVGGDLTLTSAATINVSGRGYLRGTGPGAGTANLQGGTHGGEGYANTMSCYGSVWEPVDLGSGGGGTQGRAGGGAAYLTVGGTASIAGVVAADGQASTGNNNYGGSGGSVYLRTGILHGEGTIRADGSGSGHEGGGAAGGRVAVIVTNATSFGDVSLTAYGFGVGVHAGRVAAAGTVYRENTAHEPTQGILIIDNANRVAKRARTVIPSAHPLEDFEEIVIRNQGVLGFEPGDPFDFGAMANINLQSAAGAFITVRDLAGITFPEPFAISGYTLRLDTPLTAATDWTIAADGSLSHSPYDESGESMLDLTLGGNLTVNGTIDVRRGGYFGSAGPGNAGGGQGGSYGGLGHGASAGRCYGSMLEPAHLGSGASTLGGGHVRLVITGDTAIHGSILAGCLAADTRNGSGGTVNLRTGTLSGAGEVSVTGGRVTNPSWSEVGGGGGRIAVRLDSGTSFGDVTFTAAGGGGGQGSSWNSDGGAGSVYLQPAGQTEGAGTILFDNGGHNSPAASEFPPTQLFEDDLSAASLVLTNAVLLRLTGGVTVSALELAASAVLDLNGHTLTVVDTLVVAGEEQKWGDYPATAFDETIDSDPEDKGLIHVVPPPPGTLFLVR